MPVYFAPYRDDWRVISGSVADGRGDAAYLADLGLPESIDPYLDYAGNAIPKTGAIQAGCFQTKATPVAGGVQVSRAVTVDGVTNNYANVPFYPTKELTEMKIRPLLATNESVYVYIHNGVFNWPEMDDGFRILPPFDAGVIVTNVPKVTSRLVYVSPKGSDTNDGKTAARPFKTLQAAVLSLPTSSSSNYDSTMGVVLAAAGVYDEGVAQQSGVTNRLAIYRRRVRVKGAGWRTTTIRGKHDTTCASGDGRGPLAIRCVASSGYASAVQGFTLADGACGYSDGGTADTTTHRSGGAYLDSADALVDCLITNCVAYRGAACSYGTLLRTRITGCQAGNGLCRSVTLRFCLVYGNSGILSSDNTLRQVTVYAPDESSRGAIESGTYTYNCVARDNDAATLGSASVGRVSGSVVYNFKDVHASVEACNVTSDPRFVDPAANDLRVRTSSPALTCGVLPDDYWQTYTPDVDGNPVTFLNGKPIAGALQKPVQVVTAPTVDTTYATLVPAGEQVVEPGATVTWTVTNLLRPPLGFATNGVPMGVDTVSYTFPSDASITVGAIPMDYTYLFGTNWYVNPKGDDAQDGFTADTPKGTLQGMMAVKLLAGDVVHLAEGTYSKGYMYGNTATVSNRVVVSKDITLVGDAGAAKTFILGAESPTPTYTDYGLNLGPGAIRCAYLVGSKARCRNITFCNGHTDYAASSSNNHACHGGGVMATENNVFEDCVFTNNYACRGGGGVGGVYMRCLFIENYAQTKSAPVMSWNDCTGAHVYNSRIARNHGTSMQNVGRVVNCLFEHNAGVALADGKDNNYGIMPNTVFVNNIVLCGLFRPEWNFYPTNCVITTLSNSGGAAYFHPEASIVTNRTYVEAELDATTRQIVRRDSWLVDAGATDLAITNGVGDLDLAGGQRIYNRAIDIGPNEYDWREVYAAAVGAGVAVTAASPMVGLDSEGRLELQDGDTVRMSCPGRAGCARHVPVVVTGEGVLTASANGGPAREVTAGTTEWKFRPSQASDDLSYRFDGAGHALLTGVPVSRGAMLIIR